MKFIQSFSNRSGLREAKSYDFPWEGTESALDSWESDYEEYTGRRPRSDEEGPSFSDYDWTVEIDYPQSVQKFEHVTDLPGMYQGVKAGPDCILKHKETGDLYLMRYEQLIWSWASDKAVQKFLDPYMYRCSLGFAIPGHDELDSSMWWDTSINLATDLIKKPAGESLFGWRAHGEGLDGFDGIEDDPAHLVKIDVELAQKIMEDLEEGQVPFSSKIWTTYKSRGGSKTDIWSHPFLVSTRQGRGVFKALHQKFKGLL